MTSRFISRRRFLQAASGTAALGLLSPRLARANPALLAIVPAIITGSIALLVADLQIREQRRQKKEDGELRQVRNEIYRLRERQLRREFEDRQRQDRNALVVAWIKAGVEVGVIDHKVAFDVAKGRLLTAAVSQDVGLNGAALDFEDGFVRVAGGNRSEYMHGGELEVAGSYLRNTGRMPIPLDAPHTLGNAQQLMVRKNLASRYRLSQRDFDSRFAVFGSRPYTLNNGKTDYWLHSVVDTEMYESGRPQQIGFVET